MEAKRLGMKVSAVAAMNYLYAVAELSALGPLLTHENVNAIRTHAARHEKLISVLNLDPSPTAMPSGQSSMRPPRVWSPATRFRAPARSTARRPSSCSTPWIGRSPGRRISTQAASRTSLPRSHRRAQVLRVRESAKSPARG